MQMYSMYWQCITYDYHTKCRKEIYGNDVMHEQQWIQAEIFIMFNKSLLNSLYGPIDEQY